MQDFTFRSIMLNFILIALGICIIVPCQAQDNGANDYNFATNLYKAVATSKGLEENIAISPFSAEAALSMVLAGAKGTTKSELASVMEVRENSFDEVAAKIRSVESTSESYTLHSTNALFIDQSFSILPEFRDIITNKFGAEVWNADFLNQPEVARIQINNFVEAKTDRKIHELLAPESVRPDLRLILLNALYFKADWEVKFNSDFTSPQPFTLSNGQKKTAPLMANAQSSFYYSESDQLGGAQLLELNYKNDTTSMVIILPNKQTGLQALEKNLTPEILTDAMPQRFRKTEVKVYLPKFKMNIGSQLADKLQAMGIKMAFTDRANFSAISINENLKISSVIQKVFVEVDEKGTEAAAATAILIIPTSNAAGSVPETKIFQADRPFLFLIRHNPSGSILFMGRVADPTLEN